MAILSRLIPLFYSSSGRMGRLVFALCAGILLGLWAAFDLYVTGPAHAVLSWVVLPALFFAGACVLSKRLHDRGRSGWWFWPVIYALVSVWPEPQGFGGALALAFLILVAVELFVMPGEGRFNRFGFKPTFAAPQYY